PEAPPADEEEARGGRLAGEAVAEGRERDEVLRPELHPPYERDVLGRERRRLGAEDADPEREGMDPPLPIDEGAVLREEPEGGAEPEEAERQRRLPAPRGHQEEGRLAPRLEAEGVDAVEAVPLERLGDA